MSQNDKSKTTIHPRTRANRQRWQEELVWARKLSLRNRLALLREGQRKQFLPVHPIWGIRRSAETHG